MKKYSAQQFGANDPLVPRISAIGRSQIIERLIEDIYKNGPAGLLHLRILSRAMKREIHVWQKERLCRTIGRGLGKKIDLEYQPPRLWQPPRRALGHWTTPRRGSAQPGPSGDNDCLYEALAARTGLEPAELRLRTASALRRARRRVGGRCLGAAALAMLGGASYSGNSPRDAGLLLDASQNGRCHPEGRPGHPRGHASCPEASGSTDSVEAYSYSRWRSGFLSRDDQNLVAHYTLKTDNAERLMDRLNRGEFKVAEHISNRDIDYHPLPKAQKWSNGEPLGSPSHFNTVVLVGKHFLNRHNDVHADLFVLTFYPVL